MDVTERPPGVGLAVLRLIPRQEHPRQPDQTEARGPGTASALLDGESVYTIREPITTLGRGLHNRVVLLDPAVSREHARIVYEHGAWTVENMSAHNPLWVGTRQVGPGEQTSLVPGDRLSLGQTTLQLLAPNQPEAAVEDEAQDSTGMVNLFDPGVTIQFALAGRLTRSTRGAIVALVALLFLASALVTLGTAALVGRDALATRGAGSVLAALTIPLVPALGAALLVAYIDRYEREPVVVLVAAFAWGALIAIPAALLAERALNAWLAGMLGGGPAHMLAHSAWQGVSAGLTEESVKGAGLLVLLLALRDEFDNVTDGILYGVLIGAGFAMVENFVYFAGSPRGDLAFLILGRVVLGWLGHSTFTALFGAGLGYARETRDRRAQILAPLTGFAAAVLLHSLFDFVDFQANAAATAAHQRPMVVALAFVAVLADYLPLFAAQALLWRLLLRALAREAAIVRAYLASEVPTAVVTPDEYVILQNATLRSQIERYYLLACGPRAYLAARAFHQTATGLAFRKWHVAMGDRPKATPRQPEEVYRERIARLRLALARLAQPRTPVGVTASTEL